jgi:hypothetical protein
VFEIEMNVDDFEEWCWGNDTPAARRFQEFVWKQEEIGVLDGTGDENSSGFHSYEIPEEEFPVILKRFREFFKKEGLPVK